MKTNIVVLSLVALGALVSTAQAVPAPLRSYELNGSYADTYAGPAITPEGGSPGGSTYTFGANEGLTLSNAGLTNPGTYSIEMYVLFDSLQNSSFNYIKLIDFKDLVTDHGLYSYDGDVDPNDADLIFYPSAGVFDGFVPGEFSHIVITRDNTSQQVSTYFNGAPAFDFLDNAADYAVFTETDQVMRFLQDDAVTGGFDSGTGQIDYIRIYDVELSALEVAQLVPEPGTFTLAALGLVGLLAVRFRRRS